MSLPAEKHPPGVKKKKRRLQHGTSTDQDLEIFNRELTQDIPRERITQVRAGVFRVDTGRRWEILLYRVFLHPRNLSTVFKLWNTRMIIYWSHLTPSQILKNTISFLSRSRFLPVLEKSRFIYMHLFGLVEHHNVFKLPFEAFGCIVTQIVSCLYREMEMTMKADEVTSAHFAFFDTIYHAPRQLWDSIRLHILALFLGAIADAALPELRDKVLRQLAKMVRNEGQAGVAEIVRGFRTKSTSAYLEEQINLLVGL